MLKQITTVIFDLDGTLLNTLEDLAASVNYALKTNGYPQRTTNEIRTFLGNGVKSLVKCSLGKNDSDEIFEKVWNEKVYEANNTVMVHIRRLRGKMKEDTRQNKIITTVWGVGYKIEK